LITAIVQGVVPIADKVPDIVSVIEDAIAVSKSGCGPTHEQVAAAVARAQTDNAAIQAG